MTQHGQVRIVAQGVEGMEDKPIVLSTQEFQGLLQGIKEHRNWYTQRQDSPEFNALTKLEAAVPQALYSQ